MPVSSTEIFRTPRSGDLDLTQIATGAGLAVSLLPNGAIFAIEHAAANRRIMINQTLASPLADGMARMFLRLGGAKPAVLSIIGTGAGPDRTRRRSHRLGGRTKRRPPSASRFGSIRSRTSGCGGWMSSTTRDSELACDAMLIQDLGLGDQGFLMNNEAYACQYLDHHVAAHPRIGQVLMSRQNLSQGGAYPWAAHGCLEGVAGFATDFRQVMGPACRDADGLTLPFGENLRSQRLQYETACAGLQCAPGRSRPAARRRGLFSALYRA